MTAKEKWQVQHIVEGSPSYPARLTDYPRMPKELFVQGTLPDPGKPCVAIVGSRMCSPYGRIQAFRFAKELSRSGVQVISGLALGIDSEAHRGALDGGTPTYAVLGCGIDIQYPRTNQGLRNRMLCQGGGVLTEYPPGSQPLSYHFPVRNRIISALADLVLVVETRKRSGSLITAAYALEQGKTVYAVPGEVQEPLSEGTNALIFDGAGTAIAPEVILTELGLSPGDKEETDTGRMTPGMKQIVSCIGIGAKTADQLCEETKLPVSVVSGLLLQMELMGLLYHLGEGYYGKR